LKKLLVMTGVSTASKVSSMFSMSTLWPFSMANSSVETILGLDSLVTWRSFLTSLPLIQAIPWSWGSSIRLHLSELVRMAPFCTLVGSLGRPSLTQEATVAASIMTLRGSVRPGVIGIPFESMNWCQSLISSALYFEVNGPAYEQKAEKKSTSPTRTSYSTFIVPTVSFHSAAEAARALISLFAKASFVLHLSDSRMAASLSAMALLNWFSRSSTISLRAWTFSLTALSLVLAPSSLAFASASSCLFGSTIDTTS